jgi:predicted nucleic acid-binding protein
VSLIDSNIVIEASHRLKEDDRRDIETFLASTTELLPTPPIIAQAIALRQQKKMGLGDALIAATALVHGLTLVTRNVKDFRWIDGLNLLDPAEIDSIPDEGEATGG